MIMDNTTETKKYLLSFHEVAWLHQKAFQYKVYFIPYLVIILKALE